MPHLEAKADRLKAGGLNLVMDSHNTQCWKFALEGKGITILPDLSRRTPAVDPDDHHLFVSLGCAAENLMQAALAHGLAGEAGFDAASDAVRVTLAPTRAQATALFKAIPSGSAHGATTTPSLCRTKSCSCSNALARLKACACCC